MRGYNRCVTRSEAEALCVKFSIGQLVEKMTAEDEIKIYDLLSALGLQEADRGDVRIWRKPEHVSLDAGAKKKRKSRKIEDTSTPVVVLPNSPWRINEIELHERRHRIQVAGLSVVLDETRLLARLDAGVKKFYGQRTTCQLVKATDQANSWWCLLEFVRPGAREELRGYTPTAGNGGLPLGAGGFRFTLAHDGERILVSLTEHFSMGYIPPEFVTATPRYLAWAFGLGPLVEFGGYADYVRSLFEVSISPLDIALVAGIHEPEKTSRGNIVHSGFPKKFWEQYLLLRERLVREHFANGGGFGSQPEGFGVRLVTGEGALRSLLGVSVPVEVLESREGGKSLQELDQAILDGKTEKAARTLEAELSGNGVPMLLCRRAAVLAIQSVEWRLREKNGIDCWAPSETRNKLYLSAKLMTTLEAGDHATGLETLSLLGELLMEQIPGADEHRCLDLVLPELLGDLWSGADARTAAACYKRILARRGEQPRVLRKLVGLCRSKDDTVGEVEWLRRLILVEQRKNELARIYLRLAELQASVGDVPMPEGVASESTPGQEVLRCGLRALELDRTLNDAAMVVADELVRQSRPLEAIHIVEQLLRETRGAISQKAEARLEAKIGRVWARSLVRPDLAEKRFETALSLDPSSQGALEDLEEIYRSTRRHEKLAQVLDARLVRAEKADDHLESHKILEELVSLYRGPLAQPRKALDLYFRFLDGTSLDPAEIDRVMAWDDVMVDWQYLHDRIAERLGKETNPQRISEIYCRLAIIARDRLNDDELVSSHYRQAFDNGFIDTPGFRFLVDAFTAKEDWFNLTGLYELYLKQISSLEKPDICREYLLVPMGPSDDRRDELAVSLIRSFGASNSDLRPSMQRLEHYRRVQDVSRISKLTDAVLSEIEVNSEKVEWLEFAIKCLTETASNSRYDAIDRLYRAMVVAGADQVATFQLAVAYLCYGINPQLAFPYAQRLVALHVLPNIPLEAAQPVFDGYPRYLAAFYSLMADGNGDRDAATHLYRMAASELKKAGESAEDAAITERLLGRICSHSICESAELSQLHKMVRQSGNWPVLAKAIAKQAEFAENREEKAGLLLWLAEVYRNELRDVPRSRAAYLDGVQFSSRKYLVWYSLATLEVASGNGAAAAGYIRDFLADFGCLDDSRKVLAGIRILLDNTMSSEKIKPLVKPLLEEAQARGLHEVAGEIGELLISRGVSSLDLIESVFSGKVKLASFEEATGVWLKSFELLSSSKRTRAWLESTRNILATHNKEDLYPKILGTALADDVGAKVGRKARRELLVALGLLLFGTDGKRKRALRVLQEAFVADPSDQRIWIPLYFATQEFGSKVQRRRYLKAIIPRIERDQKVLLTTPLTVESLRAELDEVSEGVDQNVVQKGKELPDPNALPVPDLDPGEGSALQNAEGMGFTSAFDAGAMLSVIKPMPVGAVVASVAIPEVAEEERLELGMTEEAAKSALEMFGVPEMASWVPPPPVPASPPAPPPPSISGVDSSAAELQPAMTLDPTLDLDFNVAVQPAQEPSGENVPTLPELPDVTEGNLFNLDYTDVGIMPPQEPTPAVEVQEPWMIGVEAVPTHGVELFAAPDADPVDPGVQEAADKEPSRVEYSIASAEPAELQQPTVLLDTGSGHTATVQMGVHTELQIPASKLDSEEDLSDWRTQVRENKVTRKTVEAAFSQAFASEVEKHIALQVMALVSGSLDLLQTWHWRVWRHPEEYGYPMAGRERFPEGGTPQGIGGNHHRMLVALAPILVRAHAEVFSINGLAKRLKVSPEQISRARVPLAWDSGFLGSVGFGMFAERIQKRRFLAFHLPGLGPEVFYDGKERTFYLDMVHYKTRVPSALFHHIQTISWSIKFQYFVPLQLDPVRHVMPVATEVKQILAAAGLDKLKSKLGLNKTPVAKALEGVDFNSLQPLVEKLPVDQRDDYAQLWDAMTQHIYRVKMAETLDVVGIMEEVVGRDLLAPGALASGQIYRLSPQVSRLIDFALALRL